MQVFISTPMTNEYKNIRKAIAKGLEEFNYTPILVEEKIQPGELWPEVVNRYLQRSDFVIADVTGNNMFVAFELGYASAIRIPTLVLIQKGTDLKKSDILMRGQLFMQYDPNDLTKLTTLVRNVLAHSIPGKRDFKNE